MRRREFLSGLGGTAAWPAVAWAQPPQRRRRIAVLIDVPRDGDRSRPRLEAFVHALMDLGWSANNNIEMEVRWGASTPERSNSLVGELLAFDPDVVLTSGSPATIAFRRASAKIPIVFVLVTDPVGAGLADSLARPGGQATGFTLFEYAIAGKWLELIKEIAPSTKRVAVLRDAGLAVGAGQFGAIQAVAPSLAIELRPLDVRNTAEIERGLAAFSPGPNDGMIITATPLAALYREQIISLAARYKMPSVFAYRHFVTAGGLVAYGPDLVNPFRRAASYVNRILRGEKPEDLPIQAPTTYELAINLKTAKALGIAIPTTLLARADEVIE